jgi:hypothetical protein
MGVLYDTLAAQLAHHVHPVRAGGELVGEISSPDSFVTFFAILHNMVKHDNTAALSPPVAGDPARMAGSVVSNAGEVATRLGQVFARWIRQLDMRLETPEMRQRLAGLTDEEAMLAFLSEVIEHQAGLSARERVLLEGRLRWLRILERSGGLLDSAEVSERLGISPDAVRQRQRRGQLIAIKRGGRWRYPAIQFTETGTLPGLPEVLKALDASPVRQVAFLATRDEDGETLAEALASSDPERLERVLLLARQAGEHGAA